MQGEYRGDFTRDTFDPTKRFLRVLYQQGRVQLDADHNEQVSILLHYLQSLAKDLFGEHGGPCNSGFEITALAVPANDFNISGGHYYVDGILSEVKDVTTYRNQPDYPVAADEVLAVGNHLVYLDVWERHITHIEDDLIREVALGGPDTATRAKVLWQVKAWNVGGGTFTETLWNDLQEQWQPANRGQLRAKGKETPQQETDPCITSPESRYRGAENQLYRVEIHTGGRVNGSNPKPTFKWSRENGSVTFPIREFTGNNVVVLEHLGRDSRFGLVPGDWVEIVDDDYILNNRADPLLQVDAVDRDTRQVTLKSTPVPNVGKNPDKHRLLRRWDHKAGKSTEGGLELMDDGAAKIVERVNDDNWLLLEDGVMVQFQPGETYRSGDYWLIPARYATGDVEWPGDVGIPEAMPPHGVEHHYAPLAIISVATNGEVTPVAGDGADLRLQKKLTDCELAMAAEARTRRSR